MVPGGAIPTSTGGPTVNSIPAQHNDAYMSDTEAESSLKGIAV
jgi:hypothetical protein